MDIPGQQDSRFPFVLAETERSSKVSFGEGGKERTRTEPQTAAFGPPIIRLAN